MTELAIKRIEPVELWFMREAASVTYTALVKLGFSRAVELRLYRSWSRMSRELAAELAEVASRLGVEASAIQAPFSSCSFHHGWLDKPCISIAQDAYEAKRRAVARGELEHEVGHSALHGRLEYYLIRVPKPLLKLADFIGEDELRELIHILASAVKDYEVSELLASREIIGNQVEMLLEHLPVSSVEVDAVARGDLVALANLAKPFFCAAPIAGKSGVLREAMRREAAKLPRYAEEAVYMAISRVAAAGSFHERLREASEVLLNTAARDNDLSLDVS